MAEERLSVARAVSVVRRVTLNTSNETVGFYIRLGFAVVRHVPNGYRQGLDRYDLALDLPESN